MQDWKFLSSYVISDQFLAFLTALAKIPGFGKLFRSYLFSYFSRAYDIIVNFLDAHEEAASQITNIIENKHFVDLILKESKKNTEQAEKYVYDEIENMFPEIAKAIQMRRAQYYLLVHEYSYVDYMLKKGQIEDKEAGKLKNEIDKMIVNLEMHEPEIELLDQYQKIVHHSRLSYIFD